MILIHRRMEELKTTEYNVICSSGIYIISDEKKSYKVASQVKTKKKWWWIKTVYCSLFYYKYVCYYLQCLEKHVLHKNNVPLCWSWRYRMLTLADLQKAVVLPNGSFKKIPHFLFAFLQFENERFYFSARQNWKIIFFYNYNINSYKNARD